MGVMPLNVPNGWNVMWNHFSEIDDVESLDPNNEKEWLFLVEDISLFRRFKIKGKDDIDIDLGWYPEDDPNGTFKIYVIRNYDWNSPEEIFYSRSNKEISNKLQEIFDKYTL